MKQKQYKIIVEKHPDGYVAYPLGMKGVVVGQGNTYEEALNDVKSAIKFHIETFGEEVMETDPPERRKGQKGERVRSCIITIYSVHGFCQIRSTGLSLIEKYLIEYNML